MSNKKATKKSRWGGRRKNAGRKPRDGGTERICVSVTKKVWQDALKKWQHTRSQLVDHLLRRFAGRKATI
jgi:hypothetical protein